MSDTLTNEIPQGFYFDQKACIGCRTCQIACKDKNDLEVGILFRRVVTCEVGAYPAADVYHYSSSCNHCQNPACVDVCPVKAMHVNEEDGTVQPDTSLCIGCQYCVSACPYGVPQFDEERNVSSKCDACISLRSAGEDPACVSSCPMRALEFGDVSVLEKNHPDGVDWFPLLPKSDQTRPSIVVRARPTADSTDFFQAIV